VPGPVARAFDYAGDPFAAGRHRGVDFAVRPGQPVRAACAGRVVFAGTAGSSGPTVSVRCGAWRVAYLPLRSLVVRRGEPVARGTRLGTAAAGGRHAGLHVGVRHEGRRWAYVDPLRFFGDLPPPVGAVPREVRRPPWGGSRPVPHAPARVPQRMPHASPRAVPHTVPRASARAVPQAAPLPEPEVSRQATRPPPSPRALAPWPAWAGLGLALAGASGSGLRLARRRRVAAAPLARAEGVASGGLDSAP
jgi:Peptidase family M23